MVTKTYFANDRMTVNLQTTAQQWRTLTPKPLKDQKECLCNT